MKYQRDSSPQGTNAFPKSSSHIFHLCPLSLKLLDIIPLVKVLLGIACSNINSSVQWLDKLLKSVRRRQLFNMIYASHPSISKKIIAQGGFLLPEAAIESPCLCDFWCAYCIYKLGEGRRHSHFETQDPWEVAGGLRSRNLDRGEQFMLEKN